MSNDPTSPRAWRRDCLNQLISEVVPVDEKDIGAAYVEAFVRLPFAFPADDITHDFPIGGRYESSSKLRDEHPAVALEICTIDAPWIPLLSPDIFRGIEELAGLPGADQIDFEESRKGAPTGRETWLRIVSGGARLEGEFGDVLDCVIGRGLERMNRLISAYRLVTRDASPPLLSLEKVGPLAFWRTVATDDTRGELCSHMLPLGSLSAAHRHLAEDEAQKIAGLIDMHSLGHPFLTYRDWFDQAEHARAHEGDPASAVIYLQTAVESLLVRVLEMTYVDDGTSGDEIASKGLAEAQFKTVISSKIPERLGGNWSLDGPHVKPYWRDLYALRCRVVHGGISPTYEQMELAFRAYSELMDHLIDRLHSCCKKYPRTFYALVGYDGIERRNWMTRHLREFMEQVASEQHPYWWPADRAGRALSG